MKKSHSSSENFGWDPSFEDWPVAKVPTLSPASAAGAIVISDPGDDDSFPLAASTSSVNASAATAKPVATIAQLADYLVNGFWTYNSTIAHHWSSNTITYNISGLNTAEQFLAQSALEAWHEVANVTFVQTTGAANITFNHNGTMTAVTSANWTGSGAMVSATVDISADWITNDGGARDGKTGIDSYGYQTYIHEIGHALGLGHQGPYNGSAAYSTNALYTDDTWQYSIMSYFAQNNYSGSTYRYVVTPQMADIYAVDSIYGAATTRTGDTVYGFHSTAGSIFDFSAYSQAPALTIYDSGGNDTLDGSGYSVAQIIDLHPGAFSSVGGLVNNIGIALNTTIENAIGGTGNDTLIANDSGGSLTGGAGNDTLIGGAGNDSLTGGPGVDILTGGGGVDTFVFNAGDSSPVSGQHDRITDFVAGTDHIDLSGIDAVSATPDHHDMFDFISTTAFDGSAGELDYFYNSALGVTILQGDINGDRVIETSGVTSLTALGGNYYLYASGAGSGPSLKYAGAAVFAGQFAPFVPIGAEQTASGYDIAWKVPGADQYTIWTTDSSGNFISYLPVMSGSSAVLESFETVFQQDLNGDGVTGIPITVIDSAGTTDLTQVGSNFYLYDAGVGPSLKFSGAAVVPGQFGAFVPIGAEQTATGYDVAWKVPGADQYTVWSTDSNGNYTGNIIGVVAGNSPALQSLEATFHQDLNGDTVIGVPITVIDSAGTTDLTQVGSNFYLYDAGAGPSLKFSGAAVAAGQFAPFVPIGAEQTASGYDVAWKVPGADQYTVWSTDSNGNYTGNIIGVVAGSNSALQSLEATFHQDLNGDGVIGVANAVIDAIGSTDLVVVGNNYVLHNSSSGTGPVLTFGSVAVVPGQFAPFVPIGAEQTASGYDVAWKVPGADQYTVWSTDSSGNYISNIIGAVSGTSTALESLEPTLNQDLNGDGVIGVPAHQASLATPLDAAAVSQPAIAAASNDAFAFHMPAAAGLNSGSANPVASEAFSAASPTWAALAELSGAETQQHVQLASDDQQSLGWKMLAADLHTHDFIIR
jgi:serralysin